MVALHKDNDTHSLVPISHGFCELRMGVACEQLDRVDVGHGEQPLSRKSGERQCLKQDEQLGLLEVAW